MPSNPTTGGAPGTYCSACGARLNEGATFCHKCGAKRGAPFSQRGASALMPLAITGFALVALAVLVATQFLGKSSPVASAPPAAGAAMGPGAVDIGAMSPQEQADRLFNRVMQYSSSGKDDSAKFFAPMAISAIEALAPLSLHQHYDLGLVGLAAGDAGFAAAQSDTILKSQPTHLLGLVLGARAAEARGATAARAAFEKRLVAAEPAERARNLPEYQDHDADIRLALKSAKGRTP
jgi:hypothetical protein